ncbi:MAG: type IX secretion system anionic LPS delivery protein PorZ [Bacteroidota bacterium]
MRKSILYFTLFLLIHPVIAQEVAIGQWKDHLSYKTAISVTEGNGKVYCATTSGVFVLNKSDNSMERLTKVNALSDVEATVLNFNKYNNTLLIAYKNANLDILHNDVTTNIGDIKRKSIIGNKSINNIHFINQYAYLSCGFGIVVVDMDKYEVKDTYYIGPNGNSINVRDITSDDTYIYAATDMGIYRALKSNPNLANYTAWVKMGGLPNGIYNTITSFDGKIYTNLSRSLMVNGYNEDTIYVYDNTAWSHFPQPFGYMVLTIKSSGNKLVKVENWRVGTYDTNLNKLVEVSNYYGNFPTPKKAVLDNSNTLWIADDKHSLVSWNAGQYSSNYPNGPTSTNISAMSIEGDNLWVAPGGINISWQNLLFTHGLYSYNEGQWSNTKGNYPSVVNLDTAFDIVNVLVDPNDFRRVYAASWGEGVIELYNGVPVKQYNNTNSSLQTVIDPTDAKYIPIWVYGLDIDESRNLWVTNSGPGVSSALSVKKLNGSWQALNFSSFIGSGPYLGQILIDKFDQKWIVLARGNGILVYAGGTLAAPNSSNTKKLTSETGKGALPSIGVYCLAEDLDGEIWVGTDKGIAVFYSPENVFNGQNFDSQQILLEQDGHVQILLETELVQTIAVDGANRKWIGTANSGVFLMSPDGTKQIAHFDENNSPLFSNDVKSIAINQRTGEVYFGTSKGIISFRGTATEGFEDFTDVYAFPNPVKPNYDGPIAIKGLINNTTLKITDISGTLVYETKSEGGQALWYGKNFKNEKVSSGVYLVFCTGPDGTKKMVTKILLIN